LVDVPRGTIYRLGSIGERYWSYARILGTALAGAGIVLLLQRLGVLGTASYDTLMVLYGLMVVGVVVHIIKKAHEISNAAHSSPTGKEVAVDNLFLWVHVREWQFLVTITVAVLVFLLLGWVNQLSYINAFLAGYAVDSFSDVALHRFTAVTSKHIGEIQKILSPAP
jgi:hypothetical protein